MRQGVGGGSTSNERYKTRLVVDERTKGNDVGRQAPGRDKFLGRMLSREGDQG